MKAYTVYQPYAYATVAGLKHYEIRTRPTRIRGRVAVHAGKQNFKQVTKGLSDYEFWKLMEAINGRTVLPLGAVVGTVEIVDCVPVEDIIPIGVNGSGPWAISHPDGLRGCFKTR